MRSVLLLAGVFVAACASHTDATAPVEAGSPAPTDDAAYAFLRPLDGAMLSVDASIDGAAVDAAAGDTALDAPADAGSDGPNRFITQVIDFQQGTCAGFHGTRPIPEVVLGPPMGGGACNGSTDVLSLGGGGSIIVGFGGTSIVDGPGVDFIVFENPFDYGNGERYVEPGEVAVSDDGVTWTAFPCTDTTQAEPDGGWGATRCGGMNLVFSNPYGEPCVAGGTPISPFDVAHAGGDQFDLAEIGVKSAKYVRIRNLVDTEGCPEAGAKPDTNGFDLDAIAIINASL